ncbi:MAG: hypothetical protein IJ466_09065 [Clostridia bacterium]|nr:hypothetical protein [Clostridia bacterium]
MSCPESNRPYISCCRGSKAAVAFLLLLIALALGLILGAVFAESILPAIAAVIVFAAALLAVVIALVIYWYRRRN